MRGFFLYKKVKMRLERFNSNVNNNLNNNFIQKRKVMLNF